MVILGRFSNVVTSRRQKGGGNSSGESAFGDFSIEISKIMNEALFKIRKYADTKNGKPK
jgi:hypothetical protein